MFFACLISLLVLFGLIIGMKHSIIIPIIKPNKTKSDPNSYRPISITSSLCKIMERLVTTRLSFFLESKRLLTPYQAGFRKGRSCLDQMMCLQDKIIKSLGQQESTLAVFIDYEKRLI